MLRIPFATAVLLTAATLPCHGQAHKRFMGGPVTLEDPQTYTRPWKMSMPLYRRVDRNMQLLEYECNAFDEAFRTGPFEPQ